MYAHKEYFLLLEVIFDAETILIIVNDYIRHIKVRSGRRKILEDYRKKGKMCCPQ
jgi:hypothetical protein